MYLSLPQLFGFIVFHCSVSGSVWFSGYEIILSVLMRPVAFTLSALAEHVNLAGSSPASKLFVWSME